MQLIATRNFRNTHHVDLNGDGKISADEYFIKKGTTFSIGGKLEFDKMTKADQHMVALLAHSHCVADASDERKVAAIEAEVKQDEVHEKRAKATSVAAGSAADLVKQLTDALAALTKKSAPAN